MTESSDWSTRDMATFSNSATIYLLVFAYTICLIKTFSQGLWNKQITFLSSRCSATQPTLVLLTLYIILNVSTNFSACLKKSKEREGHL